MFRTKNPFLMFATEGEEGGEAPESTETPQEGEQGGEEGELEEIDPEDAWDADRALAKIRKLNSEIRATKERLKAAEETAKEGDPRVGELETKNLHLRVGLRLGLPEELIDRLRGSTEEEVMEDAEGLLALVNPKRPTDGRPKQRLRGGTEPAQEPEETDPRKLAAQVPRM